MELNLQDFTLDGQPVQWDDVVMFVAEFASKNPEHLKAQQLVTWLYGFKHYHSKSSPSKMTFCEKCNCASFYLMHKQNPKQYYIMCDACGNIRMQFAEALV